MKKIHYALGGVLLTAALTSCSPDTAFSRSESAAQLNSDASSLPAGQDPRVITDPPPPSVVYEEAGDAPEGIIGGHFDLDTSHLVYGPNNGTTDHHVHEYDDKYRTNGADFFNLAEAGLGKIQSIIPPQKRFILIIANAELSKGGMLDVNGSKENVLSAQNRIRNGLNGVAPPRAFTLGAPVVPGDQKLSDLKIFFDRNVIAQNGLIPTATGCVRRNKPGAKGEYRDGALVIQALDADRFKIDPLTGVASAMDGGLLWEATIFWHRDGNCY